jgi:2-oxoglutarate dehydrogenase E2 component (dihydrolipoamide succinyltransferase)
MVDIVVPALGESVTEATIAKWLVKEGDAITADQPIIELETDKVTLEVNAPAAGVLKSIKEQAGATVGVGALLGAIEAGAKGAAAAPVEKKTSETTNPKEAAPQPEKRAAEAPVATPAKAMEINSADLSPAVRKMISDNNLNASSIQASGKDGRLTKEDVQKHIDSKPAASSASSAAPSAPAAPRKDDVREERVKMTKLRQTIARRLKEAQNTAAMLTTFNEIDMSAVMALRNQYKDQFEKRNKARLGFMSFFVKATVKALKEFPGINAEINGDDVIYKNYYDLGVAVSTPTGLIVPVLRDCDTKTFAEIENGIADFGKRAGEGKVGMAEMTGGTFTITNGGVFGSLMSTPILNSPQSGILGMHSIKERPIAVNGQVVIRPMMYVALSYDHRIVDGSEAVRFLVKIKEAIEDPQRLLLDV